MVQPRLPFGAGLASPSSPASQEESLRLCGLFAGIGGIELGLQRAGHTSGFLCEKDAAAAEVLRARFPEAEIVSDVRSLTSLPAVALLAAGFPCQDLSISGRAAGITGDRSGLVGEVFRLLETASSPPRWLLIENVPFMLRLQRGEAMRWLTTRLTDLGYRWAYRIVTSQAFGLPQRRERILLLASQTDDPRGVLLGEDAGQTDVSTHRHRVACGFYWTEGHRGLGWSNDCLPPIKVGSGLGIPSPPAVWMPEGSIMTPDIRDLERLQGFPVDHTLPASAVDRRARWRLLGNAVSVPLAEWIGRRLRVASPYDAAHDWPLGHTGFWPDAAWGEGGHRFEVAASKWPVAVHTEHLADFLRFPGTPLSARAATGLLGRLQKYGARVPDDFVSDLQRLAEASRHAAAA